MQAALDFLEIKGVDTRFLPELATYEAMIEVASHELDRSAPRQVVQSAGIYT